jgi:hypothetical protein
MKRSKITDYRLFGPLVVDNEQNSDVGMTKTNRSDYQIKYKVFAGEDPSSQFDDGRKLLKHFVIDNCQSPVEPNTEIVESDEKEGTFSKLKENGFNNQDGEVLSFDLAVSDFFDVLNLSVRRQLSDGQSSTEIFYVSINVAKAYEALQGDGSKPEKEGGAIGTWFDVTKSKEEQEEK